MDQVTETKRIRWEDDGSNGFEGYAGTSDQRLFDVWQTSSDFGDVVLGEWLLSTQLPGRFSRNQPHGNDPEALKAEAEKWLDRFASSLGAVFPDPQLPECHHCHNPITGTPVVDPDDLMDREFCSDGCLTTASEASHGAFAATEFN